MDRVKRLLLSNRAWAQERTSVREDYFALLAEDHAPQVLWIGDVDARIPPDQITGAAIGEVLVHRNVGHVVIPTDANLNAVLEYALIELGVEDVIVCGQYGGGAIQTAMSTRSCHQLDPWLVPIRDVYQDHQDELELIADPDRRRDRFAELHVVTQVRNLVKSPIVQRAWHQRRSPSLHGWMYRLETGHLSELVHVAPGQVDEAHRLDVGDTRPAPAEAPPKAAGA